MINENELANRLKIDRKTVVNHLDILEKSYVVVSVRPFSRNPRREIGKRYKIYFVDLGIRNALIGDFNPLAIRADQGALWENFLLVERMKLFANRDERAQALFWRSYTGAEVDYIEKPLGEPLRAYELKCGSDALDRGARSFQQQYQTPVRLINQDNYLHFVGSQ